MIEALEDIPPPFKPYCPRGSAKRLFDGSLDLTKYDEVLMDGPSGTGKTLAALMWISLVGQQYDGTSILISRKTRESMSKSCLQVFEEEILQVTAPDVCSNRDRTQRDHYKMPNGTRYEICGITDADRVKSAAYDIIYCNELTEFTERDYALLNTRLRKRKGGKTPCPFSLILGDTNPDIPSHWVNRRFDETDREYNSIPARRLRLISRHEDNPMLWDEAAQKWTDAEHGGGEDYIRKLDSLPYTERMRMRWGQWIGSTGLVYGEFNEKYHVIPRSDMPPITHYVGAIDFGITNAGVLQIWGIDGEERGYLVHETHAYDRGIDWWAERAVAMYHKYRPRLILCDPARRDVRELFNNRIGSRYGNPMSRICIPANNEHSAGIFAVKSALERELHLKSCGPDCRREDRHGKARMYIIRDATENSNQTISMDDEGKAKKRAGSIVQEFQTLPWKKVKEGHEDKEEWDGSVPHDSLDACRYFALYNERKNTSTRRARTQNPHRLGSPAYLAWQQGDRDIPIRRTG